VVNNTISDSIVGAFAPIAILSFGPAIYEGNVVRGITGGGPGTDAGIAFQLFGSQQATGSDVWHLTGNKVLKDIRDGGKWSVAVQVNITDNNATLHLKGNHFEDAIAAFTTTADYYPLVTFSGDTVSDNAFIYYKNRFTVDGRASNPLNGAGKYNDIPLFGSSDGTLSTSASDDIIQYVLDNTATPSVKGRHAVSLNTANITITDLLNGVPGQTLRILAVDNNATAMTDGGNLKLAGTWAPTAAGQTISLWCTDGTTWAETKRSAN
jgi:hypothetical protein